MPIYLYEITEGPDAGARFEVMQSIREDALTHHPETGAPVQRLIGRPGAVRNWGTKSTSQLTSDANLKKHGFARYERAGDDGTYRKTGGVGPDLIKR
ncbi:MAG: hypothetical protein KC613_04350 [Myxococcales bacterium]|nr:hypothetical protein [Myxococcales bacterium]MCB9525946.1 FmdB family transcriptional regulator [Myxococcales bacterium]